MNADLPALKPAELAQALAISEPSSFVPDTDGTGTTLYLAREGSVFAPAFGPDSRNRHLALGARELPAGPGLRQDVDTLHDLSAARELGLGPRTTVIAEKILDAQ
jgi:2-phospho-L-lactate guanylyltransferase